MITIEKLMLLDVAATMTAGVISNLPDDANVSVDITDPEVRAENLMAWNILHAFYVGLVNNIDNEAAFPSPKAAMDLASPAKGIAEAIGAILPEPFKSLIPAILAALPKVNSPAPVTGPVPNPGA
jgi:hypothetical protein